MRDTLKSLFMIRGTSRSFSRSAVSHRHDSCAFRFLKHNLHILMGSSKIVWNQTHYQKNITLRLLVTFMLVTLDTSHMLVDSCLNISWISWIYRSLPQKAQRRDLSVGLVGIIFVRSQPPNMKIGSQLKGNLECGPAYPSL